MVNFDFDFEQKVFIDIFSFLIDQIDKPGPPLDLTIESVGNDWIELIWQSPIRDGGSPITGYVIERRTPSNYKWHVSEFTSNENNSFRFGDF